MSEKRWNKLPPVSGPETPMRTEAPVRTLRFRMAPRDPVIDFRFSRMEPLGSGANAEKSGSLQNAVVARRQLEEIKKLANSASSSELKNAMDLVSMHMEYGGNDDYYISLADVLHKALRQKA